MPPTEFANREKNSTGQAQILEFYGLRDEPFGVTPNPRYLYYSPSHREALASLVYAIETKRGFSALVAEPGMGKTTLLFHLLEKMKNTARTAFLFRPDKNAQELLESLLNDLGMKTQGEDVPYMHELLNAVLLEELNMGKHFVWVLDEAQDLDIEVLETVRLLSNFETSTSKLMHIVLAGQPALADKLSRPELLQLRQRVSTFVQLAPLSPRETAEYMDHRVRVAGNRGQQLFATETQEKIAKVSRGIPRNINSLCFSCLSLGFVERARRIGPEILQSVLADYEAESAIRRAPSPPSPPRVTQPAAAPKSWLEQDINYPLEGRYTQQPRRSALWYVLATIAFLVIPAALVVLQNSNLTFLDSNGSPAEAVVEHVTGYDTHSPGPPPATAAARAPEPPGNLAELDREAPVSDSSLEEGAVQASTASLPPKPINRADPIPATAPTERTGPRVVYATHDQTIFQLAMEYYGKASWTLVERIRSQNPGIRDPFATIKAGQRVVLPPVRPEELFSAPSKHSSHWKHSSH